MKWFDFPQLPVDLRLEYQMPSGSDSLTPEAVRNRYEKTSRGKFVIWISDDESLIGFKEGIDEVTIKTTEFLSIVLIRWLPAKGSGLISLETESPARGIIASKCYSVESNAWISEVVECLKSVLGERVTEAPITHDA
jgi:hypothetical protein